MVEMKSCCMPMDDQDKIQLHSVEYKRTRSNKPIGGWDQIYSPLNNQEQIQSLIKKNKNKRKINKDKNKNKNKNQ